MISVSFFAAGPGGHLALSLGLIRSIAATMPGAPIRHLTDASTPAIDGTETVRLNQQIESREDLLALRLRHYGDRTGEPTIHVDSDVLFQHDVRHVFARAGWDVALTDRAWPHLRQPHAIASTMPFNTGVAFTRDATFWQAVLHVWSSFPRAMRNDWLSEQRAVTQVASDPAFVVRVLPGAIYNFPPDEQHAGASAAIVHYKGPRKTLMLRRIGGVASCASAS